MSRRRQRVRHRHRHAEECGPSRTSPGQVSDTKPEPRLLAGDENGSCPFDDRVLRIVAAARYGATLLDIALATGVKPTKRLKLTEIGLRTASRLMAQGRVKATANNRFVAA
jgi:hypothetical protein